jgi:MFS family permease
LIAGRLLYGLATGILAIATPRLMEETVPPKYIGSFAGLYCLSFAFATITADLLASLLPHDDDTAALAVTNRTLIMLGMPLLFYFI